MPSDLDRLTADEGSGMSEDMFSVVLWDREGYWHYVRQGLGAEEAVKMAKRIVDRLEAGDDDIDKVAITDAGDFTNFLWERGKGIVYPPRGDREAAA